MGPPLPVGDRAVRRLASDPGLNAPRRDEASAGCRVVALERPRDRAEVQAEVERRIAAGEIVSAAQVMARQACLNAN